MPDILSIADHADMIVNGYAFSKSNGDTVIQNRGVLTDRELSKIQSFIKDNYKEMYLKWASMSENGFFGKN